VPLAVIEDALDVGAEKEIDRSGIIGCPSLGSAVANAKFTLRISLLLGFVTAVRKMHAQEDPEESSSGTSANKVSFANPRYYR